MKVKTPIDIPARSAKPTAPATGDMRLSVDSAGAIYLEDSTGNEVVLRQGVQINHIGEPGKRGFGQGICPADIIAMYETLYGSSKLVSMNGTYDINSPNYGNYQFQRDGSIMVWIPFFWQKKNADNTGDVKHEGYFANEAAANAAGYSVPRGFIDGGIIQRGVFIDKYKPSLTGITFADLDTYGSAYDKGTASSIKGGNPISSSAESLRLISSGEDNHYAGSFSNCSRYSDPAPANNLGGAIAAAKSRGQEFHALTVFSGELMRFLSQIHKQTAIGTLHCAWNDITPAEPRGNNNYGVDYYDSGVTYAQCDDNFWGYKSAPMEARKCGGGTPFAKTTHNGQDCGICIDCNQWEFQPGVTSKVETAQAIVSITRASQAVLAVTNAAATNSNYANGKPVMILGSLSGEWAALFQDKIFTISDLSGNTFKIKDKTGSYVNSAALSVAYSSGLTSTTGKFYVLKESVTMWHVSALDSMEPYGGTGGFADMYEEIDIDFNGVFLQQVGNGSNQVFSGETSRTTNAYKQASAGIPMNKFSYGAGTALMGYDYFYMYIMNELAGIAYGTWFDNQYSGIGAHAWHGFRTASMRYVSFRCGLFIG